MSKAKKCPICKKTVKGRFDKKFCGLKCKNIYNYKLRRVTRSVTKATDEILHRNRSILLELMGKRGIQKKLARTSLDAKNFNYNYVTGYHQNSRNKIVNYVYDYSWVIFSDQNILVKRIKK